MLRDNPTSSTAIETYACYTCCTTGLQQLVERESLFLMRKFVLITLLVLCFCGSIYQAPALSEQDQNVYYSLAEFVEPHSFIFNATLAGDDLRILLVDLTGQTKYVEYSLVNGSIVSDDVVHFAGQLVDDEEVSFVDYITNEIGVFKNGEVSYKQDSALIFDDFYQINEEYDLLHLTAAYDHLYFVCKNYIDETIQYYAGYYDFILQRIHIFEAKNIIEIKKYKDGKLLALIQDDSMQTIAAIIDAESGAIRETLPPFEFTQAGGLAYDEARDCIYACNGGNLLLLKADKWSSINYIPKLMVNGVTASVLSNGPYVLLDHNGIL